MRTPRTLFAALISSLALSFAPAFANDANTVEIQIDLEAPAETIYKDIRKQAWTACKPETGSRFIHARTSVRRACQKAMIADVVDALASPDIIVLAQKDGIRAKS